MIYKFLRRSLRNTMQQPTSTRREWGLTREGWQDREAVEAASSKRWGDSTTSQRETRQLQEKRCNKASTNHYVGAKQEVAQQERGPTGRSGLGLPTNQQDRLTNRTDRPPPDRPQTNRSVGQLVCSQLVRLVGWLICQSVSPSCSRWLVSWLVWGRQPARLTD